jgi:hypothetical protein
LENQVMAETVAPQVDLPSVPEDYEDDELANSNVPDIRFTEQARTYDELLRKVTAAEVFAATQDVSHSQNKNDLVPLLNSLKEDLLRLRSVA